MSFDSLVNRGDYFSAHYLAEVLPKDLKKSGGLFARWSEEEKAGRTTPRKGLRGLSKPYFAGRPYFAELDARLRDGETLTADERAEWRKELGELHGDVLRALGYVAALRELTVERAGKEHTVEVAYADRHLVAIECGWAADVDAALDDDQAGRLLAPVRLDNIEEITSGTKLATWLLTSEEPPRYVLILAGGVVVLADRAVWGEGRYLAVSLDVALGRGNEAELGTIAALFGADSLLPPEEGGSEPLAELLDRSRSHAVGVSKELRDGLKESVELIANEVLARIRAQGVRPEDVMEPAALAKELGRESLRYLYRILFLLYAEARPELGILPTDDEDYVKGYSLARLGDLVVRDLTGEEARNSFHLYESLDLLFRMVNQGHRPRMGAEIEGSEGEGLRFEPLRSDLFEPEAIKLIGRDAISLDEDDPDAPGIDTRLRNETLYKVLRKLMLTKGRKKERGGFISYAQLGINQLGAVYEGLMSYTGFIAAEELYEVAKGGDPKDGSWLIPASKVDDYPSEVFVHAVDEDGTRLDEYKRYRQGAFVYRLAGRDRETSASYYTPESLTRVTVQLALQHRLDQDDTVTPAREILEWKICEPALGSGAFLNEAINQVAAEYLKRRQQELGVSIDPERFEEELQKVKAYVALHNSYGVDLNETAIELAEVSLWLNVMHPGLQAPWFGLHLRRGNSLIGAARRVYGAASLTKGTWLKEAPEDLPFSAGELPSGKVHHFLLPAEGWGAVAGAKEAKELAPEQANRLKAWRKQIQKSVSDKKKQGQKFTQLQRLQALSKRAEYLWDLVQQRLAISEREISRKIDVWGADWIEQPADAVPKEKVYGDLTAPGTPYWRLKKVMDAWCALWFWPLDKAGLLDGSDEAYARRAAEAAEADPVRPASPSAPAIESTPADESIGFGEVYVTDSLFSMGDKQLDLAAYAMDAKATKAGGPAKPAARKPRPALEPLRPVIPLATLDDWLDFAEALLGRAGVPENSLVESFASLDDLEEYENQLPAWTGMDSEFKLAERFPWLDVVEDITDQQGFFHWELQFAQVFTKGGFDLQVGNPPWVRPDWQEDAVLAELEPWFKLVEKPSATEWRDRKAMVLAEGAARTYYLRELLATAGTVETIGSGIAYPLLAGTRPDLYRAFMCRIWTNLGLAGTAGLIHPDTHFSGVKEGRLRAASYRHLRLHAHFTNELRLFEIGHTRPFGIHIYGPTGSIGFVNASWLFHPVTLLGSLEHDGSGKLPGIKHEGKWELRPHRERLIQVDEPLLARWQRLTGSTNIPVAQAPLLYPVSTAEAGAIEALAAYQRRLGASDPRISSGYNEKTAKDDGLIRWRTGNPESLNTVILQGPHLAQATPYSKQPNIPCKTHHDWSTWDLTILSEDAVPVTNYERACDEETYRAVQDLWYTADGGTRRYTEFYRLAWRVLIDTKSTERSLFAALIPPGPAHVDAVGTLALGDNKNTALAVGFWAALPLDYLLRITGRSHLRNAEANAMPAADSDHPLAPALLLRTLRLNCLTNAYAPLWAELYDPVWNGEQWAADWPRLKPLGDPAAVTPEWAYATPLRTERERRAALVELDALVALWLGMTAEQLVAIYRSRYPVLSDYEAQIWFDANGRKIAGNHNTYGYSQTKQHFEQLMAYLDPEINGPVPDGYTAPFYKAGREAEYRQAHAVFSERLRQAGWEPPTEVASGGENAS
ncbi:Eco57I restriction-modification methylase domain-containing protein [Microbispora sp. H11081]|uniref:Eco57I restriction-modification methylase domain-containing protein n=1 Tax=Microbispora sp. H11081 TaxID=2729107 RepID=UPI0014747FE7|nr:class I SAM-dependent DNA methyltransferase [Microbispora sp. H11081]